MEKRTTGTVVSVKKQWWLKVNTKPVRMGSFDGAVFPHIVKVKYTVDGNEIMKQKWLGARVIPPSVGEQVVVVYREENPKKCRIEGCEGRLANKRF